MTFHITNLSQNMLQAKIINQRTYKKSWQTKLRCI